MAKVTQVQNNDTGLQARMAYNAAIETVETGATITGDGNVGTELNVDPSQINTSELNNDANFIDASGAPVQSVNGESGIVVLDTGDVNIVTDRNYVTDAQLGLIDNAVQPTDTQIDWISGIIEAPEDKRYKIVLRAAYAGSITLTTTNCDSGTCTATFEINNVPLGGGANSVSTSTQNVAHASANTFVESNVISILISANADCVDMNFTIKLEYNLQ